MRSPFSAVVPTVATAWVLGGVLAGCGGGQAEPQTSASTSSRSSAPVASAPSAETAPSATPVPAQDSPPAAAAQSPSEKAARTLGLTRDAFNAHDANGVAEQYAEDCVVDSYTGPSLHGRAELVGDLQRTFAAFEDIKVAPLRGWVKGGVVASEIAWTATMTGEFLGLKATRKPVGLIALRVLRLTDDGKVKEAHEYADAAGLVAQMIGKKGAPPAPLLPTNDLGLHAAKDTPDEDELAAWAKSLDETFGEGSPKVVADAMSDEVDYWTNFGGMAVKGKRAVEKSLAAWFKAFPDQKWESTDSWGVDGFAILEHTMSGTQKGAFGDHPASNKAVSGWRRVDILQPAVEGTVLHEWGFANVMEMLQQTGAIKRPADMATTNAPPTAHKKSAAPAPKKP
jgi:steroid delta-isomerase-like uncharacterized protein